MGLAYSDLGCFGAAVDCLEQSLKISAKTSNIFGTAVAINNLGEVHYRPGRVEVAIEFLEQGLLIYRELRDRCREAETLRRLVSAFRAAPPSGAERAGPRQAGRMAVRSAGP